jgi:hypothetical protein
MEAFAANIRNSMMNQPSDTNSESPPLMSSNSSHDFRKMQLPGTKIGLGSAEGDLIYMVKKYLEIVGLVFFVWLLGE